MVVSCKSSLCSFSYCCDKIQKQLKKRRGPFHLSVPSSQGGLGDLSDLAVAVGACSWSQHSVEEKAERDWS